MKRKPMEEGLADPPYAPFSGWLQHASVARPVRRKERLVHVLPTALAFARRGPIRFFR
jgi:hypothetical protein